jgi:hypothetical protein
MTTRIRTNGDCGKSRREFLGEVGMAVAASLLPISQATATTLADGRSPGADAGERAAENKYPGGDVRRCGVVPNSAAAAEANTAALAALVKPAGDFSGNLFFPNTTGQDVYYFNDVIPFHEGVHIDLMKSTLNFSKAGVVSDSNAGFFHAIRDFSIENGAIVVDYTHKAGSNTGNALSFGARGSDSVLFPNTYDSLLPASMGKIVVRDVHISSNAGGGEGRGILMLGGLDGVLLENVTIDGQGQLLHGVYYEFGWATNEAKRYLRQSSHAHNFLVKNLVVNNVTREGFAANGMYGAVIDGLKVTKAGGVCAFGPGESMFFRPWSGVGDRKAKPYIVIRNVVGESISNVGIGVTGASKMTSGYLDNPPAHDNPNGLRPVHLTDLIDFTLDTFSISGTADNYGVSTSAGRAVIRNGTLTGFQRGVVTTQECTRFVIDSVKILDSTSLGIQIGQAVSINNPPRPASGIIRDCVIAGSGAAGASAAIAVGTTQGCIIENCRFGYDQSHDYKTEKHQTQAVAVAADAFEVVCRNNFVGGTADNSAAYVLAAGPSGARQCRLIDNSGIVSATGAWLTGRQGQAVQPISNQGTITTAGLHSVWVTTSAPVSGIVMQPGTQHGQTIVLIHDGAEANSIDFGPADSSNVATGTESIRGRKSRVLVWSGEKKLWHLLD